MGEYTDSLKLPEGSLATEIITDLCCLIILSTHQLRAEDPSLLGSTHTGCLKNPAPVPGDPWEPSLTSMYLHTDSHIHVMDKYNEI